MGYPEFDPNHNPEDALKRLIILGGCMQMFAVVCGAILIGVGAFTIVRSIWRLF